MNPADWLDAGACVRLTRALGHFLWQGAAVAAAAMLAAALLRRASARARYALFVAALGTMAACPPVTFVLLPAGEGPAVVTAPAGGDSRDLAGTASADLDAVNRGRELPVALQEGGPLGGHQPGFAAAPESTAVAPPAEARPLAEAEGAVHGAWLTVF